MEAELKQLEEEGIVELIIFSEWVSPIVELPVVKGDGFTTENMSRSAAPKLRK